MLGFVCFFFIFIVSHSKSRAQKLKLVLAQAWPSFFATTLAYTDLIVERKRPTLQVAKENWAMKFVKLQVLNLTCGHFWVKMWHRQKNKTITNIHVKNFFFFA